MNDAVNRSKFERTSEQKAFERQIREQHRLNPVQEVPTDLVSGEDAAQLLALAASIRREREAIGLSVEQLAGRAKVDPGVLARFESGAAFNPPISILLRLARALDRPLMLGLDEKLSH